MFSGGMRLRRNARARRGATFFWVALFVLSIGLQYVVALAPAPVIAASGLKAGTVAGFEVDGDLVGGNAGSNPGGIPAALQATLSNAQDWLDGGGFNGLVDPADPPTSFIFRDAVDGPNNIAGDATPDTSAYVGGNKEFDTRDWGYVNSAGPNAKTDYRHVMAGVKVAGGSPFVFLGAERVDATGTMVVDFELNQKPFKTWADGIAKPDRSLNDVLISLEYSNGGSNPIVTLYYVSAITSQTANGQVVSFTQLSDATTIDAVRSATNFVDLAAVQFPATAAGSAPAPYTVGAFRWAEASVDLSELNLPVSCLNFGQGSIRSRTGGSIDTSQLKDATGQFPLSVNTCAQIRIEKVDKAGNHVGGASFSISPNPLVGAPGGSTLPITDNDANDLDNRDGYILIGPCEPQVEYTVTETTAPVGYVKDPAPQSKTAPAGETVRFEFVNDLGSIRWEKNGPNGTSLLGGATFTVTPNPKTGSGVLTVVDNGPNDTDDTPGEFRVSRVLVDRAGGYTIAESEPPTGYIGSAATAVVNPTSADPDVAVAAGTWVNLLGSIAWTKRGPDGTSLLGGATFTVTPNPKTGTGTLTVVDNGANDADPDLGELLVSDARTGTYAVQETAAPSGYIIDPDPANVTVSAAERNASIPAGTFVNNLGKIRWLKYGPDGQTLLGGATFQVSPDPTDGVGVLTVADCVTQPCTGADRDDTPGEFEIQGVPVGTYTITETVAPAGYIKAANPLTAQITSPMAAPFTANAGSVTNTLAALSWLKHDGNGQLLGGAVFTVTGTAGAALGFSADVADNTGQAGYAGLDTDTTAGEFTIANLKLGTYQVVEKTAPAGYIKDTVTRTVEITGSTASISIPFVNTLAALSWLKHDGNGQLLGGAVFTVTGTAGAALGFSADVADNTGQAGYAGLDTDTTAGEFTIANLKLGTYQVVEKTAPAGYIKDTVTRTVEITGSTASISIPFVNTLAALSWLKHDGNGQLLGGAVFTVTGTAGAALGFSADVADNTGQAGYAGLDTDTTAGEFTIANLKLGTYQVVEKTAPAGYIKDTVTRTVEITGSTASISIPFVNTLGELRWTKDKGDQAKTPLGGATFTVTPNPYSGGGSLTVVDNDASDVNKADGAFRLVAVPTGTYLVDEIAAPEGYAETSATCSITVSAANPTGTPACSFSNPPIPPAIDVVKTAGTSRASQAADGATLQVETFALPNVTYKYVVTNTGVVRLLNVTVVDDNGTPANAADDFQAACEVDGTGIAQPFELDAGDAVTCYALRSVTQATTNVVTAAGVSVGEGTPVSATDDAVVEIVGPAIDVEKTAGASAVSQAADGATYETEIFTDNVTYRFVVTNTGTTTLVNVTLTDDKLGTISCPATTLAAGASMTCTATTTIGRDTINVAVAAGTSPAGQAVDANDAAAVEVLVPSIDVVKTAGDAADGATLYTNGGNVLYTYVVTNDGDTDLDDVTVVDDRGTATTADDVTLSICTKDGTALSAPFELAVGESMTCTVTIAVDVDTTNIATATGTSPADDEVSASDDAVVLVRRVTIAKVNDAEAPLPAGAVVAYTLTLDVTHGPIPVLTVVDDLPEDFGTPSSISDGGVFDAAANTITWQLTNVADGKTLTYDVEIGATTVAGTYVNVATITVGPCVETEADDQCSDDSTVVVEEPGPASLIVRKLFDLDGKLETTNDRVVAAGWAFNLTVANGTLSALSGTTGQDGTVTFSVTIPSNGETALVGVTEVMKKDFKILAASCVMGTQARGTRSGLAMSDVAVRQDETVTCTFVNATGDVQGKTSPPRITPPPTDALTTIAGDGSSGMLLVILALVGLVAVLGIITPAPARARRRSRRG